MKSSYNVTVGDTITFELSRRNGIRELTVAGYFEDAFMGSSMIDMKSFLISADDWSEMRSVVDTAAEVDVLGRNGAMFHIFQSNDFGNVYDGEILKGAIQVSVGQSGDKVYTVDMYNNAAVNTMLGYLSGSPMLFPAYDYDKDQGFVTHSIRGTYTRDDEISVTDIKAGEIYLLSGGQLRLYFMDVEGANITATPVGYFTEADDLTETVNADYEANQGNSWGVDVYFMITKT